MNIVAKRCIGSQNRLRGTALVMEVVLEEENGSRKTRWFIQGITFFGYSFKTSLLDEQPHCDVRFPENGRSYDTTLLVSDGFSAEASLNRRSHD